MHKKTLFKLAVIAFLFELGLMLVSTFVQLAFPEISAAIFSLTTTLEFIGLVILLPFFLAFANVHTFAKQGLTPLGALWSGYLVSLLSFLPVVTLFLFVGTVLLFLHDTATLSYLGIIPFTLIRAVFFAVTFMAGYIFGKHFLVRKTLSK